MTYCVLLCDDDVDFDLVKAESGALTMLSSIKSLVVKANLDTKIVNPNQALIKVKESAKKTQKMQTRGTL